jgi:predicted nucleic acid-binding Zn ribbon protein
LTVPPDRQSPDAAGKDSRLALAGEALAQAKADAAARGNRPAVPTDGDPAERRRGASSPTAGQQSRRQRRDDPAPLSTAIDGLVSDTGWELAVATGSVFGRWAQIVGPDLAAHTSPDGLVDGELTVVADSTAWATQLRLLAADLVRKLNVELGDGSVRRVNVRAPEPPPGSQGNGVCEAAGALATPTADRPLRVLCGGPRG